MKDLYLKKLKAFLPSIQNEKEKKHGSSLVIKPSWCMPSEFSINFGTFFVKCEETAKDLTDLKNAKKTP